MDDRKTSLNSEDAATNEDGLKGAGILGSILSWRGSKKSGSSDYGSYIPSNLTDEDRLELQELTAKIGNTMVGSKALALLVAAYGKTRKLIQCLEERRTFFARDFLASLYGWLALGIIIAGVGFELCEGTGYREAMQGNDPVFWVVTILALLIPNILLWLMLGKLNVLFTQILFFISCVTAGIFLYPFAVDKEVFNITINEGWGALLPSALMFATTSLYGKSTHRDLFSNPSFFLLMYAVGWIFVGAVWFFPETKGAWIGAAVIMTVVWFFAVFAVHVSGKSLAEVLLTEEGDRATRKKLAITGARRLFFLTFLFFPALPFLAPIILFFRFGHIRRERFFGEIRFVREMEKYNKSVGLSDL